MRPVRGIWFYRSLSPSWSIVGRGSGASRTEAANGELRAEMGASLQADPISEVVLARIGLAGIGGECGEYKVIARINRRFGSRHDWERHRLAHRGQRG